MTGFIEFLKFAPTRSLVRFHSMAKGHACLHSALIAVSDISDSWEIRRGLPNETKSAVLGTTRSETLVREINLLGPKMLFVSVRRTSCALIQELEQTLKVVSLPVVLFAGTDKEGLALQTVRIGVTVFVVDGLRASRINTLTSIAFERFDRDIEVQKELRELRHALAARKTIEKAKGIVMERQCLSEQRAYELLRSLAMRDAKPLFSVAEEILAWAARRPVDDSVLKL